MTEFLTTIISVLAGIIDILLSVLLGFIFRELRAIRREMKEYVPDKYCKIMMSEHERRIENLENRRNNQNNYYARKGRN
jgi:hypothetical protein